MAQFQDVYRTTTSSQLSPKAQEESADHELVKTMGINRRPLDESTYDNNTDADEDTFSSTPGIQSRTSERNRNDRANLIQERYNPYPNPGVGPFEIVPEGVIL